MAAGGLGALGAECTWKGEDRGEGRERGVVVQVRVKAGRARGRA